MTDTEVELRTRIDLIRKDLLWQLSFLSNPDSFDFEHFKEVVEELEIILNAVKEE